MARVHHGPFTLNAKVADNRDTCIHNGADVIDRPERGFNVNAIRTQLYNFCGIAHRLFNPPVPLRSAPAKTAA